MFQKILQALKKRFWEKKEPEAKKVVVRRERVSMDEKMITKAEYTHRRRRNELSYQSRKSQRSMA